MGGLNNPSCHQKPTKVLSYTVSSIVICVSKILTSCHFNEQTIDRGVRKCLKRSDPAQPHRPHQPQVFPSLFSFLPILNPSVSFQAFTIIDQNRDGIISKDDLRDVLASMGESKWKQFTPQKACANSLHALSHLDFNFCALQAS